VYVPRLPVLHGEQCHLCFDSIHKLLGKFGIGTRTVRLGYGSGTGDGEKAGLGIWDVQRDVEERGAVFLTVSIDKKAGIPGLQFLTAMINFTGS
jgi:hypothetical protein